MSEEVGLYILDPGEGGDIREDFHQLFLSGCKILPRLRIGDVSGDFSHPPEPGGLTQLIFLSDDGHKNPASAGCIYP